MVSSMGCGLLVFTSRIVSFSYMERLGDGLSNGVSLALIDEDGDCWRFVEVHAPVR